MVSKWIGIESKNAVNVLSLRIVRVLGLLSTPSDHHLNSNPTSGTATIADGVPTFTPATSL